MPKYIVYDAESNRGWRVDAQSEKDAFHRWFVSEPEFAGASRQESDDAWANMEWMSVVPEDNVEDI